MPKDRVTVVVPPVVTALYEAVRAQLPPEGDDVGVRVTVGPDTSKKFARRAVALAATWDEDLDPVSVERVERGARPLVVETITVSCSAMAGGSRASDRDFPEWRDEVGELLAGIDRALRADVMTSAAARSRRGFTRWVSWYDKSGGGTAMVADFVIEITTLS